MKQFLDPRNRFVEFTGLIFFRKTAYVSVKTKQKQMRRAKSFYAGAIMQRRIFLDILQTPTERGL